MQMIADHFPAEPVGGLTDVEGLCVGHHDDPRRPTGCTVVRCEAGAVCGVEVRGGAPGTRETELLRPDNTVQQVHAVLLTGGSAFGLDAAGGVMRWLAERGHGLAVGPARVPIVPAAVLFDLWLGDPMIHPDAAAGYAACEAASTGPVPEGSVGAGRGATVGKLHGIARATKGGIGTASLRLGDVTVAALVAVNAVGDVMDEAGGVLAGARAEDGGWLGSTAALTRGQMPPRLMPTQAPASLGSGQAPAGPGSRQTPAGPGPGQALAGLGPGLATTIGVVATDATLTKAQATQLARLAHHGLSRAVDPITPHDGDTLFALATGRRGPVAELSGLGALAAEVVARAIRRGVRTARRVPGADLPARDDWIDASGRS
jgi:L-aminopeptidase/D-esterase-like protein